MGTSDKAKGKGDPHTLPTIRTTGILHSGAYPNEIVEGRDTDPMALDLGALHETIHRFGMRQGKKKGRYITPPGRSQKTHEIFRLHDPPRNAVENDALTLRDRFHLLSDNFENGRVIK